MLDDFIIVIIAAVCGVLISIVAGAIVNAIDEKKLEQNKKKVGKNGKKNARWD